MEIEVKNGWKIKSDRKCLYLTKPRINKKDGIIVDKAFAFYSDFDGLLEGLVKYQILKSNAKSFKELRQDLDTIKEEIKKIVNEFMDIPHTH